MTAEAAGRLEIVTTPTFDWLAESAASCKSRLLVASPFVNGGITGLTERVSQDVSRTLLTRADLRNFALGSSNLHSLCALAKGGVTVHHLDGLHAKVYVFDDTSALVTSANATVAGMSRNWECGLATSDRGIVAQLAESLLTGFGAANPPRRLWATELERLHVPVTAMKASLPKAPLPPGQPLDDTLPPKVTFSVDNPEVLLEGFTGWKRLTLRGVLAMPADGFSMQDLFRACAQDAAREYPKNRHVEAKLRQQLQVLRGLGLVEFVRPGWYRYTIEHSREA